MSNILVSQHENATIFEMQRDTAGDILELYEILSQDILNTPSYEVYRALINTHQTIYSISEASVILNNYAVIGRLRGHNYRIALLIHGDPATFAKDAKVNWEKGGFLSRTLSVFEAIVQAADAYKGLPEMQNNPLLINKKVEVIYGEEQALDWLQQSE